MSGRLQCEHVDILAAPADGGGDLTRTGSNTGRGASAAGQVGEEL